MWIPKPLCIIYDAFFGESFVKLDDIGRELKGARKRAQISQSDLAGRLGMSRATISALEGGRCVEIGVRKLMALLESVGLELSVAARHRRPTIDELRAEHRRAKAKS
jgi:transcriptional regulator with XRE-family HTH domain